MLTLASLMAALLLLVPQAAADDQRAQLRQVLPLLAQRPMSDELVEAYQQLHARAYRLGDFKTAHVALERIPPWWERQLGAGSVGFAAKLNNLAAQLQGLGDYAAARPLLERCVAIFEKTLGPEHPYFVSGLNNLGEVLKQLGDYGAARPLFERALATRELLYGHEHEKVADSLNNLATLLTELGANAAALPLQERSLAIWEAVHGPDHPRVAWGLTNLAGLQKNLGEYAVARSLCERAVAILEAAYGPEHKDISTSLTNLGGALQGLGDFAAARPVYERSLAIREAAYGLEHPKVADGLGDLADLFEDLGDWAAARSLCERALAIQEAAYGPEHPTVALSIADLADLHHKLGDHEAALALHERALPILEAALGPEHPQIASSLISLARVFRSLGDDGAARPLFERSLAIIEAAYSPDHPNVGASLNNLAGALRALGEHAAARTLYERSLKISEAAFGPEHPLVAANLHNQALLSLDEGNPEAAFSYARRLTDRRSHMHRTLASLTEGESYLFLEDQRGFRHVALAAAVAVGDDSASYATVLWAKGQVARLALQTRVQVRANLAPGALASIESLAKLTARFTALALKTDIVDRETHDALIESLRMERDALDRELRRGADVAEQELVTARDVAEALPPGSAVVDLLVHPAYLPALFEDGAFVKRGTWSEPRVSAWIVRAGEAQVRHVDLGPVAAIEAATARFIEELVGSRDLVARRGRSVAKGPKRARGHGAVVHALVWEPLRPHLDGVDTIFLSPDGVLANLPFGAIHDDDGRYLIEQVAFVDPGDVESLVGRPQRVMALRDGAPALLAVGGVDFRKRVDHTADEPVVRPGVSAASGASSVVPAVAVATSEALRGGFGPSWKRLPATESESRSVIDMHADALGGDARRLLIQGPAATEERLAAEMPGHAILHLATHGFFHPEGLPSMREPGSELGGSDRELPMPAQRTNGAARLPGLHPGLLSGLVFAGADRPKTDQPDRGDGYLTATDVITLDLSGVDLVVLSACETGLGRPQSGEGLLGLRRAFHMSGAETVISSLWSVMDSSTSELMQSFYSNLLLKGMGRQQALRTAQLDMLARNREELGEARPSDWGGFVLSGEWR